MSEGIKHKNKITIGFLNEDIGKNLDEYKKSFDVVITQDGDFEFITKLIKEITY